MKKLIKRLCSVMLLTMLMRPGLDAAPQKVVSSSTNGGVSSTDDVDDEAQPKTISAIHPLVPVSNVDDLKGPGYEVHIHDYNGPVHPPPPQAYKDSVVEILKYFEDTFHFINVVDKNDILATELLDESWYEWLNYLQQVMPLTSKFTIHANDIENPQEDAPGSIWDDLLYFFLKRNHVTKVDETDVDGDGDRENNLNVKYTSVKFDPIGQLMQKGWGILKEYSGVNDVYYWWKTFKQRMDKYSAFTPEQITAEEVDTEEVEDGIHHPEGVISIYPYDPVAFGVNTVLFLGWQALFWAAYLPISGIENLGADYPDIDPDEYDNGEASDDILPEEDDYADGGGEDYDDARRADSYSSYYHYDDYTYQHGHNDPAGDYNAGRPREYDVEKYTLSDRNIYVKKK